MVNQPTRSDLVRQGLCHRVTSTSKTPASPRPECDRDEPEYARPGRGACSDEGCGRHTNRTHGGPPSFDSHDNDARAHAISTEEGLCAGVVRTLGPPCGQPDTSVSG